jgi:hypothetical protein
MSELIVTTFDWGEERFAEGKRIGPVDQFE